MLSEVCQAEIYTWNLETLNSYKQLNGSCQMLGGGGKVKILGKGDRFSVAR